MASDGKSSAPPAPAAASPYATAPDSEFLRHSVTLNAGEVKQSRSYITVRAASDLAPKTDANEIRVAIRIAHKPTARFMDLAKVKGQMQLLLGLAKLPKFAIDIDKERKHFVISFVGTANELSPDALEIAKEASLLAPLVRDLFVKLELSLATQDLLPLAEAKKPAPAPAAAGASSAPPAESTSSSSSSSSSASFTPAVSHPAPASALLSALPDNAMLLDYTTARISVLANLHRDFAAAVMDLVGLNEEDVEAGTFFARLVSQTNFTVTLQSIREAVEKWTLPLPPSFWAEQKAQPVRHFPNIMAHLLAKLSDKNHATAVRVLRMARRRAKLTGADLSTLNIPNQEGLKQWLEWKDFSSDSKYWIDVTPSSTDSGCVGEVTEKQPESFIPFPQHRTIAGVLKYVELLAKTLQSIPSVAKARIQDAFYGVIDQGLALIPVEGARLVAALAKNADDTLLSFDSVQVVAPNGAGVSLDISNLIDFRFIPWGRIASELQQRL